MKVSVALPIHNMKDAEFFLYRVLGSLENQTFKDFEVVITDNSPTDALVDTIKQFDRLNVRYFQNPRKGIAPNTNCAISESRGEFVKILYLDDYLMPNALSNAVANIGEGSWLVSGCFQHIRGGPITSPHLPEYTDDILSGNNRIGSPSVLMIRNHRPLLFDETMQWLLDCDYYYRLNDRYGPPIILKSFDVVMGIGSQQLTNILTEEQKLQEYQNIMDKYGRE